MPTTTTKCPDGTFYGAVMTANRTVIAMSPPLRSRSAARRWAAGYVVQAAVNDKPSSYDTLIRRAADENGWP